MEKEGLNLCNKFNFLSRTLKKSNEETLLKKIK